MRDDEFVRVGVFPFGFDAGHLGLAVGLVLGGVDVFIFLRGLFLGGAFGGFFGSLVETFVSEKSVNETNNGDHNIMSVQNAQVDGSPWPLPSRPSSSPLPPPLVAS